MCCKGVIIVIISNSFGINSKRRYFLFYDLTLHELNESVDGSTNYTSATFKAAPTITLSTQYIYY